MMDVPESADEEAQLLYNPVFSVNIGNKGNYIIILQPALNNVG